MRTETIKASLIEMNLGQVEGVPSNPRNWTVRELEKLQKSLRDTPELLAMRPPIVVRHGSGYVVLGGNMRVCALISNGVTQIDCIVLPEGMEASKLKEIVIKDNASMGAWKVDALAKDWSGYDLEGFGIPKDIIPEASFSAGGSTSGSGGGSSAPSEGGGGVPTDNREIIEIEFSAKEFSFVNQELRDLGDTPEEAVKILLGL